MFECYGSLRKNYALESLGGVASQSCEYFLPPSKGIDGIIDNTSSGNFEGAHTCHSDTEVEKSWEVELAVRTNVDSVTIYNRNDDRMEPVILQLYDGSELVHSKPLSGIWQNSDVSADGTAENDVFTVPIGNVVATKVKLYRAPGDTVPINFHELEVRGMYAVSHLRITHVCTYSLQNPNKIYQMIACNSLSNKLPNGPNSLSNKRPNSHSCRSKII